MTEETTSDAQDTILGPLAHVIEEAAADAPWALIGGTALRIQGIPIHSPNLEFIARPETLDALAAMLDIEPAWGQGQHLHATRLHFLRHGVPVFVFADPAFHGRYDTFKPAEIPSLWDARVRAECAGVRIPCTPPEWEFLLAVILEARERIERLRTHLRHHGYDSRLMVRLLREGHAQPETEDAVWSLLERSD